MNTFKFISMLTIVIAFTAISPLQAYEKLVWGNRASDMNDASSWNDLDGNVSSIAPSKDTVLVFSDIAQVQPVLTGDLTVIGLHFGSHTNANPIDVHAADGYNGYNYSGYHITSENGATLTLDGNSYNNGWTSDVRMSSLGTNIIDVAVTYTDKGGDRYTRVSGGCLIFNQPITVMSNSVFYFQSNAKGRIVLTKANPDLTPKTLRIHGDLEIRDPHAISSAPYFLSTCWGWGWSVNGFDSEKACYLRNTSGEPAYINAEVFETQSHDGFRFTGDPIYMTNTTYKSDFRDTKPVYVIDTAVYVKEIVYTGGTQQRAFNKQGDGAFINLGGYCVDSAYTNHLQVSAGAYIAMKPEGLSKYRNLLYLDVYPSQDRPAVIGTCFDYAPTNSALWDYDLTVYHARRPGGFAAYNGDQRFNLYDGAMLYCNMTHPIHEGNYKQSLSKNIALSFTGATGTTILENDIDLNCAEGNTSYNSTSFYVYDGTPFVDARLEGMITNAPASKPTHLYVSITKREAGVLALDNYFYGTSTSYVKGGGLLINDGLDCNVVAEEGAWVGGTGKTRDLQINSGAALRPGELGGTLDVSGNLLLQDGAGFIIDINSNGVNGLAEFTGSNVELKSEGGVTVKMNAVEKGTGGNRVKILDWGNATITDDSAFNLDNYTVEFDPEDFFFGNLYKEDTAIYLTYRFASSNSTMIFIR